MEQKQGMKPWVKVLLIVGVVLLFFCGGGALLLWHFISPFTKGITDNKTKLETVKKICDIEVPNQYQIFLAMDLGMLKMAMFNHPASSQQIFFITLPDDKKGKTNMKDLKKAFDDPEFINKLMSRNSSSSSLKIESIREKRTDKVKGHEFPYALCGFDRQGRKMDGIVGLFYCPDSNKAFMVMAMNNPGKYDNKVTLDLMESLKCH
jgi:hypothetical protein